MVERKYAEQNVDQTIDQSRTARLNEATTLVGSSWACSALPGCSLWSLAAAVVNDVWCRKSRIARRESAARMRLVLPQWPVAGDMPRHLAAAAGSSSWQPTAIVQSSPTWQTRQWPTMRPKLAQILKRSMIRLAGCAEQGDRGFGAVAIGQPRNCGRYDGWPARGAQLTKFVAGGDHMTAGVDGPNGASGDRDGSGRQMGGRHQCQSTGGLTHRCPEPAAGGINPACHAGLSLLLRWRLLATRWPVG